MRKKLRSSTVLIQVFLHQEVKIISPSFAEQLHVDSSQSHRRFRVIPHRRGSTPVGRRFRTGGCVGVRQKSSQSTMVQTIIVAVLIWPDVKKDLS